MALTSIRRPFGGHEGSGSSFSMVNGIKIFGGEAVSWELAAPTSVGATLTY
jgi:hypothetical protein